ENFSWTLPSILTAGRSATLSLSPDRADPARQETGFCRKRARPICVVVFQGTACNMDGGCKGSGILRTQSSWPFCVYRPRSRNLPSSINDRCEHRFPPSRFLICKDEAANPVLLRKSFCFLTRLSHHRF